MFFTSSCLLTVLSIVMVYLFNHEVLKKDFKHDCIQNRSHKMIFIETKLIIRVFYRFLVKSWKKAILSSWFYIIFVLFANHIYKNNIFFLNGIQEIKKFKLYSTFVLLIGNLRVLFTWNYLSIICTILWDILKWHIF